jgi:hypothetical protein
MEDLPSRQERGVERLDFETSPQAAADREQLAPGLRAERETMVREDLFEPLQLSLVFAVDLEALPLGEPLGDVREHLRDVAAPISLHRQELEVEPWLAARDRKDVRLRGAKLLHLGPESWEDRFGRLAQDVAKYLFRFLEDDGWLPHDHFSVRPQQVEDHRLRPAEAIEVDLVLAEAKDLELLASRVRRGPLGVRVELADRFDRVAEELDPERPLRLEGKNIQDVAAGRDLTRAPARVARAGTRSR